MNTPLRRCVGCNCSKPKNTLVRIVRQSDGTYVLDTIGRANGRGAYLCNNISCLTKARKRRGLERSFSARIDQTVYDELERKLIHADE